MGFNPEIQNYRNRHESYIRNYYINIMSISKILCYFKYLKIKER